MKIQVTGTGDVLHGVGEDENKVPMMIRLPPGIHVTSDEDENSMITPQLAKLLIKETNGHVVEYTAPDPAKTSVTLEASPTSVVQFQGNQKELDEAQAAQKDRFKKARAAQEAEGTVVPAKDKLKK